MSDTETPELDLSWKSDLKDVDVEVSDDLAHDGQATTDWWPSAVEKPPDEMNADQRAVIKAAVFHPNADSVAEIQRKADFSEQRTQGYATVTLSNHWPERHAELVKGSHTHNTPTADDVREFRRQLLDGMTAAEVGDELGFSDVTVINHAKENRVADITNPSPLRHDGSRGWVMDSNFAQDDDREPDDVEKPGNDTDTAETDMPDTDDWTLVSTGPLSETPLPEHALAEMDHDECAIFRDGDRVIFVPIGEVTF